MQVKIEHLIPFIVERIAKLELQVVHQTLREEGEKRVYENKFLPRLFGWEWKPQRDFWSDSWEQIAEREKVREKTLNYYLNFEICSTVNLEDFTGWGNYAKVREAILAKHIGEYVND